MPSGDPQFAYGYGLTYAAGGRAGPLSEESGILGAVGSVDRYFVDGRYFAPWSLMLRDEGGELRLGNETSSGASPRGGVSVRSADGYAQESARTLTFGADGGHALIAAKPVDLVRQANGEMALQFRYRIDVRPSGPVMLTLGQGRVDVTALFNAAPLGQWRTLKVRLSCLRDAGANLAAVDQPWGLSASGGLGVTVEDIRLGSNEGDAVCPAV